MNESSEVEGCSSHLLSLDDLKELLMSGYVFPEEGGTWIDAMKVPRKNEFVGGRVGTVDQLKGFVVLGEGLAVLEEEQAAFQAAWILDGVLRKNDELLIPLWDRFTAQLAHTTNPSVLRSFAKICELVCMARWKSHSPAWKKTITEDHCELLTQSLFDWLIGPQKVAVKVFAMTSLYYLGEAVPWINHELTAVIESQLPGSSAGFKNRGQKTLKALLKRKQA